MRLLSRRPCGDPRFLLLTGAVMREAAKRLLGLRPCGFRPQHSHKLGGSSFFKREAVAASNHLTGFSHASGQACSMGPVMRLLACFSEASASSTATSLVSVAAFRLLDVAAVQH